MTKEVSVIYFTEKNVNIIPLKLQAEEDFELHIIKIQRYKHHKFKTRIEKGTFLLSMIV